MDVRLAQWAFPWFEGGPAAFDERRPGAPLARSASRQILDLEPIETLPYPDPGAIAHPVGEEAPSGRGAFIDIRV